MKKWVNIWECPATPLFTEFGPRNYTKKSKYKKIPGNEKNTVFSYAKNSGLKTFNLKKDIKKAGEVGYKAHKNKKFILQHIKEIKKAVDKTHKFAKKIKSTNLKKLKNKEILKFILEYEKICQYIGLYNICNDEYQEIITKKVKNWLENELKDNNLVQETFSLLCTSSKLNTLEKYELELLLAVKDLQKKLIPISLKEKETKKHINKIIEKYGWVGTGEFGKAWDKKFLLKELKEISKKKDLDSKINNLKNRKSIVNSKLKKRFCKINSNDYFIYCKQMAALANGKLEMRLSWSIRDYYFEKILKEIERRNKVEDLLYYRVQELIDLVSNEKLVNNEEIKKRKKYFAFYLDNSNKVKFYSGIDAKEKFKEIIGLEKIKKSLELKGMVANRGIARGRVKIISPLKNQIDEMKKIKDGDILVTGMTRPHMLPAMRKAIAFVTDEGGITCHAAIVSREMNKVCVVATKNATKILKDGDEVEVNGDLGIVKILN